jgi:hypothetical protein
MSPLSPQPQEGTSIMGLFDWFSSTKRPESGSLAQPAAQVRESILAINRPTAPFQIIDGSAEGVDLIAEWKIVDASWYEIFARASLEKAFRIKMKLDETSHEVRAVDEEYSVSWRAGVPTLELSIEKFRGQKQSIQFGTAFAFTEEFLPGQVYNYRFNTGELKKPIQEAVTAAGWTYKGVSFGKL